MPSFNIKEHSPKRKKEKNTFYLGFPKMDKTIFDLDKEKQIEFLFTFFSFLKNQKNISPGAGFKYALKTKLFCSL